LKNKYPSSSKSFTLMTEFIYSSCSICNKLIIGIPFAVLLNSGISYPFRRYTFPLFVKNRTVSCVDVVTKCSTKSSSFVPIPCTPRPLRFCVRYVEVGRRLRSEEHTSELQSRFDLVCRLLLVK